MRSERRPLRMPPNTLCQGSTKQDTVRENPPQAVPMEHNVCTGISDVRYFSPRLLAALTGILSSPLTVIEAPMGYGKTVAVREFLRRENLAVIWVSVLDSPDGAFWRSLCREFERLPETAETARALRRLGPPFAPDDAARRDAALELLESLDFARPTVLVVDDVHLLASAPSCVRFFQILARQAMSNLHIVLTTRHFKRTTPCWRTSRESSPASARPCWRFRKKTSGHTAPCAASRSARTRSAPCMGPRADGSAAYICIAAITRNTGLFPCPPSPVLSPCPPRNLPPYLPRSIPRTNCHRIWPPFWKNSFIAHSPRTCGTCFSRSVRLSSSPCRRRISAAARILGQLWRRLSDGTRLVRRREGSGVYTVHAIFRSLLLRLFRALPREQRQAVHRRCGDWFAAEDEFIHAMEHYHAARDFERALSVMERDMARHLVTESAAFFARLFQDCPEEVLARHPKAAFKHALAALSARTFRPLPTAAAGWRATARRWTRRIQPLPCCAVNWKCCWPLRNTTTSRPCPSATAGHGNCWAAPRDYIRRNPPGAWAAPPCCSCSTGKAATSGRKSG